MQGYPKPVRALLAADMQCLPFVLATDSADVAFMVDELGASAGEIGLADEYDCPAPGLYLFEGEANVVAYKGWEGESDGPELEFVGKVRPVTKDEFADLLKMNPPAKDNANAR